MTYIPKSKSKNLIATPRDAFINSLTRQPYEGPYVEISNGNTYAGNNSNLKFQIEKEKTYDSPNISNNRNSRIYNILKDNVKNYLNGVTDIISSKSIPTEKDYERGFFLRYFASRKNSPSHYIEINGETFKKIKTQSSKYDHILYTADSIKWALTGNVFKINPLTLKNKLKKHPFLDNFFILINEFHRPDRMIHENLHTKGGELYDVRGNEYMGSYHLHPTKGPMEGSEHTKNYHKQLYFIKEKPVFVNNTTDPYRKFLDEYNKEIICNKCENGYPISNKFLLNSCPEGWTSEKNPCSNKTNSPNIKQKGGDRGHHTLDSSRP